MSAASLLRTVASQLGYVEAPTNRTRYGKWYPMDGVAWCAIFVSWGAAHSGNADVIPKHAWTPSGAAWFKARGQWHTASPRPGDIAYFYNYKAKRIAHVGIVESVLSDGRVRTIEGNSNAVGSRTGGMVCRLHRAAARPIGSGPRSMHIVGYGRPKYAAVVKPPRASEENFMSALPDVARGATGDPARRVQGLLLAAHRTITVDGDFGPGTEKQVKEYQTARKLDSDGVVGPKTWRSLLGV